MRQRIVNAATRPEFWLLCLLAWLLLSAGRSLGTPWARVALTEALRWSAGIGLALALGFLLRHTKTALRFAPLLVGALALLGIGDGFQPEQGGLTGPYQEHQLYGSVLLILLPPVVAVALTARNRCWRLGAGAAAGLGALCLFLSQTRSAWIGASVAALVFGSLWLYRFHRQQRDRSRVCLSAASLAGAVLAVWLLTAPANLSAPLSTRVGTLSTLGTDPSWQERLSMWRGAEHLVAAHPLCGIGLGRYPGAQWVWTHAGNPLEPSDRPTLSEEAHDFYLQTAAETGLIGLSLYSAALAAFIFQGLRRLRQVRRSRSVSREALLIATLSVVAGQAADAVASPSWQFAEASFFFWALLGVGMAAHRREEPEPAAIRISPALRRFGKFALSGGVALILAANVLPIGLLSPVEAYTPPTDNSGYKWEYKYGSVKLAGPTSVPAGQTVSYALTAIYYTNKAHTTQQTVTVTLDPYPGDIGGKPAAAFSVTRSDTTKSVSTFGTAGTNTRNQLTVSSSDKAKGLAISGTFYDQVSGLQTAFMSVAIQ